MSRRIDRLAARGLAPEQARFSNPSLVLGLIACLAMVYGACSDSGAVAQDGALDVRIGEGGAVDSSPDLSKGDRCEASAALVAKVNPARMLTDLKYLVGLGERSSHAAQTKAAAYIKGELSKLPGVSVIEQAYTYQGAAYVNLEASITGDDLADEVVMAGAHYDAAGSTPGVAPGADDDGSGVATILELARILSGCKPRRTVRLVFFSNEEKGTVGSKEYVKSIKATLTPSKLVGFISVDMVAYGEDDEDLDLATKTKYKAFADDMGAAVEKWTSLKVKKIISDHCG